MDNIYAGAEVTLVQAHGSNPCVGLYGISHPRSRQPRIRIGQYQLTSSFSEPQYWIKHHSPWFRRAWMYQEAILSHRCLYFTDQQVYFECQRSTFEESFHEPDSFVASHILCPTNSYTRSAYRMFPADYLEQIKNDPSLIETQLIEYTERNLSYPSDALNAFSGILHRFKHPRFNISHLYGIPILWSVKRQWSFVEGFAAGLCWIGQTTHRRHGFPSWSWAGWNRSDGVDCIFNYSEVYSQGIQCAPDLQFGFETIDGVILDWESYNRQAILPDTPSLKPILHVDAHMLYCKLVLVLDFPDRPRLYICIQNSLGRFWAPSDIHNIPRNCKFARHSTDEDIIDGEFPVPFRYHFRPKWEECMVNEEGIYSNGTFNDGVDSLDRYREWPLLVVGDHRNAICTGSVGGGSRADDCTKGPFLMVLKDQGDYYERLVGLDLSTSAVGNHGLRYWFGKDLSDYFIDAKKCCIKLG
ncbi:hypothetical protein F5B19DRAFT_356180 [Rostrohypoxylon terebratum]|nr:hypothetical protein F5B19DRAFT_356180 [Rostrohypoxylon terebratum]